MGRETTPKAGRPWLSGPSRVASGPEEHPPLPGGRKTTSPSSLCGQETSGQGLPALLEPDQQGREGGPCLQRRTTQPILPSQGPRWAESQGFSFGSVVTA